MDKVILEALIRILENQMTIKEHIGIIKERSNWGDNEYYRDSLVLRNLEEVFAEYRTSEELWA